MANLKYTSVLLWWAFFLGAFSSTMVVLACLLWQDLADYFEMTQNVPEGGLAFSFGIWPWLLASVAAFLYLGFLIVLAIYLLKQRSGRGGSKVLLVLSLITALPFPIMVAFWIL